MKKHKRAFTLLEIMIVIFLIGLIGSVIGFNMKGSLEEGKAFKTKQAMQQIEDVLTLQLAEGAVDAEEINEDFVACLKKSNLIKSPVTLAQDGWNHKFVVTVDKQQRVRIRSEKYRDYLKKQREKNRAIAKEEQENEEGLGEEDLS